MANYFNAEYYFAAKAKQLSTTEKTWTAAEVQAEFAKQGIKAEDHYKAYGASEGLSPNAYFNEKEYLASKLAALQDNDPTWANKTVADLQAEFKALGINAADHYEQYGAFETRKDGTLLNPSNAFDANAYFAAKLAQLQKIGFEGADTMTVADVVKAVQEAGISPVAHLQAYGAAEAKTDGIPLVQTVPVAQRVPNDPIRAQFGELVPSNYNPPSKAPAAAVAAPVTKPADVGGLSATKPVLPTAPVKVPGDTGYIAPPANLVDTNEKPVLPPTTTEGTGPNAGFIVVDPTTGKGTVIDPATGAEKGTVDVVVKDGVVTPPAPNAPVVDKDGNNINDKPADDTGKPVEPTPPTVDPEPEAPVDPPAVLKVDYAEGDAKVTLSLDKAAVVSLTEDADGNLLLTPEGGTPTKLKAGFTGSFELAGKDIITLKGTGALLNGKTVTKATADATTAAAVEITAALDSESYALIHADLNVTAKVTSTTVPFAYDNTKHVTVDTFDVATGATLTVADSKMVSGKKFAGDGTVTLASTTLTADTTIDTSEMTGGVVTATFVEDATPAKTLTYTGGAAVDSLSLSSSGSNTTYEFMKADIDLGSGDDMLTISADATTLGFVAESTFKGGSGSDTMKVSKANTLTTLGDLNAFGASGSESGVGFENLLLDASASIAVNLTALNKFNTVGFMGAGPFTLNSGDGREMIISNGAAESGSTAVKLTLGETVSGDTLNLVFKELDTTKAATAQAELSAELDMAAHMSGGTIKVSGSDVIDLLTLKASGGEFANVIIKADMGAGNDKVTLDLSTQDSGSDVVLGKVSGDSVIDGGSGDDTVVLTGYETSGSSAADSISFANLKLKNIKTLDVSAIDTTTNKLTLNLGTATDLEVVGSANVDKLAITAEKDAKIVVRTLAGADELTFTQAGSGSGGFTIDTGSGADTIDLTDALGSDTIILNTDAKDTITGFNVSGSSSTGTDKLAVTELIGAETVEFVAPDAGEQVISTGTIYQVEWASTAITSKTASEIFSNFFAADSKQFKTTITSGDKAIIVVTGNDESLVVLLEDADGSLTDADLTIIGSLDGVTTAVTTDNFI